jgi:uncharacterized protein (TIGR01777 family)
MRVFVAGGTGLIGSRLVPRLIERGHVPVVLTRRAAAARQQFGDSCSIVEGDPMQPGAWMDAAAGCDAAINLTGESIFNRRWNEEFKRLLHDSRVRSTENIVQALARQPRTAAGPARVLVNASAIGYYGPLGDEEVTEDHPAGNDTLARLCIDWERAARHGETHGLRVAIVRVGVVLAREGGALAQMIGPFKSFVGGPVGSGRQWISWIHREDIVGIFLMALDNTSASGPINGTAPNPVTNKEFSQTFGQALHRPSFLPTPPFALRLMLGEVADVVTTGQRVIPRRALELGYTFRFASAGPALADILQSV